MLEQLHSPCASGCHHAVPPDAAVAGPSSEGADTSGPNGPYSRATLVICPLVAVIQWRQEIARYVAPNALRVSHPAPLCFPGCLLLPRCWFRLNRNLGQPWTDSHRYPAAWSTVLLFATTPHNLFCKPGLLCCTQQSVLSATDCSSNASCCVNKAGCWRQVMMVTCDLHQPKLIISQKALILLCSSSMIVIIMIKLHHVQNHFQLVYTLFTF